MAETDGRKTPVTDEIATVEKDIYQDYVGKTLLNPDKILKSESGGLGIELYEDLLRDDKVGSTMQLRKLAVVGKEWDVEPVSEKRQDVKTAEFVKQVLTAFDYDAARRVLLSGLVMGFKASEVMWEYSEGSVWVRELIGRACRRFVFDRDRKLRLVTRSNMIDGEELPQKKFVTFTNTADNGSPYGDGLGRMLYWPVWFKKNAIKFWIIFADKFGSPTVIGKYPTGTPSTQQAALLDAIEAIQTECAIKIPDTMVIELLEASRAGSINTYENLCNFMNSAIAQVVMGHPGSTESTPGKLGSEDAALDVKADYTKADADALCICLNTQLVRWIVDYNFPQDSSGIGRKYPQVWIRTEQERDLQPLAERDQVLLDMGARITHQYVHDTYGIPKPAADDELLQPRQQPEQQSPFKKALPSEKEKDKQKEFAEMDDDWIERYLEAIAPSLSGAQQSAFTQIAAWLESIGSPPTKEEFIIKIEEILGASLAAMDKAAITDTVANMYSWYKLTDKLAPAMDIGFGGADVRAVDFLQKLDNFYISKYIQNPDALSQIRDFLGDQYLQRGGGLFGRGTLKDIQEFRNLFSQKLGDLSAWQVRRIADTSVQRIRNWAHISQMYDGNITEAVVIEPTQDCEFCKVMHGRVFQVRTAYQSMQEQTQMSPGEFESFLKATQPSLENLDRLIAKGILPPYHPHCHGRIIMRTGNAA